MALEIEFEDDDQIDAAWPADDADTGGVGPSGADTSAAIAGAARRPRTSEGDGGPSASGDDPAETRTGSTRPGVAALLPPQLRQQVPLRLGVLAATFALGVSAVAGFVTGRTAEQNRTLVELHMTGGDAYKIDETTVSDSGQWTDTFVRQASLSLVNDGPDPVTVLGGAISGPYEHGRFGLPRAGTKIAAGATVTLHAATTIDCRGVFGALKLNNGTSSPLNTVADFDVATADGHTGRTDMLVDLASASVVATVCAQVPPPMEVGEPQFSPLSPPTSYEVAYPISNAAPFPLQVASLPASVHQWDTAGGLSVTANGTSVVTAHGTGIYVLRVTVADCAAAVAATDNQFGDFPLVFTDTDGGPEADMFIQEVPIVAHNLIVQACNGH
jgi:hypothetical protein